MKKILIFYTSVGLGHKYIAQNIGFQLEQAGFEVRLEDVSKVQAGKFSIVVIGVHQFINHKLPFVWSWLYKSRIANTIISPLRLPLAARNSDRVQKLIMEYKPDVVITTQTTASAAVAYLKKKNIYTKPFGIAFSDFHLHPFWLYDQADFYLANIEEQKNQMVQLGVAQGKIFICGMTLKPHAQVDAQAVRQKLGIEPGRKLVLVGSGSLGTGFDESLIQKLSGLENACVIVVCGKNEAYQKQLQWKFKQANIKILGFYSPMDELYAVADIYVGKPGGLTTSEVLSWGLPLLVTHWLPGQEELNIGYLKDHGLVMLADDTVAQVKQEIQGGKFKNQLQNNPYAKSLVSPAVSAKDAVLKVLHRFD